MASFSSVKVSDPLHVEVPLNPRYSSPPVYHPKHTDLLHEEVPINPRYPPVPVYHHKHTKHLHDEGPLTQRYSPAPVYHKKTRNHGRNAYKGLDEAGVTETYYGLLRSRNHFAYSSPECLGNNYYNT